MLTSIWAQHIAVVAGYGLALLGLMVWARRWQNAQSVRRVEVILAILGLLVSAAVNWWWLRPEKFSIQESLPLHMCDLVGLLAPLALLTRIRWTRALLHFWGLGLCSQWVFTPVAQVGPQHVEFWISFVLHASILGLAAWDVCVGGYRPTRDWRDWRLAVLGGVAYAAAMTALNIAINRTLPPDALTRANYGYLGDTRPDAETIVNYLGAWPLRIAWIMLLGFAALTFVQLAWALADRLGLSTLKPPSGRSTHPRLPINSPR